MSFYFHIILFSFITFIECYKLEISNVNWYQYIKNYQGITIDSKSYTTFKTNIQLIDAHNSLTNNKYDVTAYLHISVNDFSKRFTTTNEDVDVKHLYNIENVVKIFKTLPNNKYFNWVDKSIVDINYEAKEKSWVTTVGQLIDSVIRIRSLNEYKSDIVQLSYCSYSLDSAIKYITTTPILLSSYERGKDDKCVPTLIEDMVNLEYSKIRYIDQNSYNSLTLTKKEFDIYSSPIAISLSISDDDKSLLQFYNNDIVLLNAQETKIINYSGLIVGFGKTNDGIPYWLVQMNMGLKWGENGIMKLSPFSPAIIHWYQL